MNLSNVPLLQMWPVCDAVSLYPITKKLIRSEMKLVSQRACYPSMTISLLGYELAEILEIDLSIGLQRSLSHLSG